MALERIQKTLAAAGCGARRTCEQFVLDGRVAVNGEVVRKLPVLVDPQRDRVTVDGKPVRSTRLVYYVLNKPRGILCTHEDPAGRRRAVDLLIGVREKVFPVGRLDVDSMGLLLMTNDGALAQRLTHPRYGVPKTYRVEIDGRPTPNALEKLRTGVWLSEGRTGRAEISLVHGERDWAVLEITLREGRNREIRRMMAKMGYAVRRLVRIRLGKLSTRGLAVGAFRPLTDAEIRHLRKLADQAEAKPAGGGAGVKPASPPRRRKRASVQEARPQKAQSPRRRIIPPAADK